MYTLSLIDYLQEFDANKYMELKLKKMFKGGGDISSVDTKSYFDRFLNFVNRIIVVCRTWLIALFTTWVYYSLEIHNKEVRVLVSSSQLI